MIIEAIKSKFTFTIEIIGRELCQLAQANFIENFYYAVTLCDEQTALAQHTKAAIGMHCGNAARFGEIAL